MELYNSKNYKKNLTIGCLMWIVIGLIAYSLFSCSSDDKPNCNCNAIYKNVWTQEQKSYPNEELNCETKEPIEPVKEETWYFVECKDNSDY